MQVMSENSKSNVDEEVFAQNRACADKKAQFININEHFLRSDLTQL